MNLTPSELIDQLNAAGGEIHIANPSERVRSAYRSAIYFAKEAKLVPEGFQLWHTGRDRGDMVIRLLKRYSGVARQVQPKERPEIDSESEPSTEPEPIQRSVETKAAKKRPIDLQPALAGLKVSKPLLPRCRAILEYITNEASARGYRVLVAEEKSTLVVVASGEHLHLVLSEEHDTAPAPPPKPVPASRSRYHWEPLAPKTIQIPNGRLALRLEHYYRTRTWADRVRWRLEDRLLEVVEHIDSLAAAAIEKQREAHEKGLRDLAAWEAAVANARVAYVASLNRQRLLDQTAASAQAQALRAFAERVQRAGSTEPDAETAAAMLEWHSAILAEAEQLDPLNHPDGLRWVEPKEIQNKDLEPYMKGWMSVYRRPEVPPFPVPEPDPKPDADGNPPRLLRVGKRHSTIDGYE